MTYLTFINRLRTELKDFGKIYKETFDGDGSTLNFPLTHIPIKDDSYTVKVEGVTKTETTDYTIDKDTGVITFVSAPASGSDNIEVSYQSVQIRDEDYLEIINDGIDHFQWKLWKKAFDSTTFTSVKNQYEYDMSSLAGLLYVISAWYKATTGATEWQEIQGLTNWKFYTQLKKLYVNPTFSSDSLPLKFFYLKSFTKGATTSATLDIPDEWLLPYKYYIYARFYERLIPERISETAAVTTFPTYAPSQVIFNIAEMYYKKANDVANLLAPKLPPLPIKQIHEGVAL